jgi:hypothetical protein
MADVNSPVRHRLELLERTIHALQAQQRLLEYRVQYIEEENQTLLQNVSAKLPQATGAGGHNLFQPYTQILTPKVSKHGYQYCCVTLNLTNFQASSGYKSYVSELQALARESDNRIGEHAKALSSLSLLDAPSLLTTPTLTPTRNASTSEGPPRERLTSI